MPTFWENYNQYWPSESIVKTEKWQQKYFFSCLILSKMVNFSSFELFFQSEFDAPISSFFEFLSKMGNFFSFELFLKSEFDAPISSFFEFCSKWVRASFELFPLLNKGRKSEFFSSSSWLEPIPTFLWSFKVAVVFNVCSWYYYKPPGRGSLTRGGLAWPPGALLAPPPPCWEPPEFILSKFFKSIDSQCLVDLSSFKQFSKVSSLSWSGKHWHRASQALKSEKRD